MIVPDILTKSGLTAVLAKQKGISFNAVSVVVEAMFGGIRGALVAGNRVEIWWFGSFKARGYDRYTGRHP